MTRSGLDADLIVSRSEVFRVEMDLMIPAGTTVALLGPNGAGKSTAVMALAGLLPIDAGQVRLNDIVLDDPGGRVFVPAERRSIGVVFQDYLLFPHLTVLENVAFGLRNRGIARKTAISRSRDWLERVGIKSLEKRKPADLSGGQAQRVALARALVIEPDLLLLDEPLAALDVTTRIELRRTLQEHLDGFSGPRLLITHDPTEAFLLADHIHILENGTITQTGTADEIQLRPRTKYVADVAGSNLVAGTARAGIVSASSRQLHVVDDEVTGPVLVTIHPTAISVHSHQPDGSPRNSWPTTVERVERLGVRVRLRTSPPLPLTIEITEDARADLALEPGSPIWVAFKATEVGVQPGVYPDHPQRFDSEG